MPKLNQYMTQMGFEHIFRFFSKEEGKASLPFCPQSHSDVPGEINFLHPGKSEHF